jgi:hypothetical protein
MMPFGHMASRYFTAGETWWGSGRINPACATGRATVPIKPWIDLARDGPSRIYEARFKA